MVNVQKLRGKIVECETNVTDLAEKIGIDKATFYRKLSDEGGSFTIKQADAIAKELNLSFDEVNAIFFAQYVADMRQ